MFYRLNVLADITNELSNVMTSNGIKEVNSSTKKHVRRHFDNIDILQFITLGNG